MKYSKGPIVAVIVILIVLALIVSTKNAAELEPTDGVTWTEGSDPARSGRSDYLTVSKIDANTASGLLVGDILSRINDKEIYDHDTYSEFLSEKATIGQEYLYTIERGDLLMELWITIEETKSEE